MEERDQNPGRKWREIQKNEAGDDYNKNFRYTPYSTDLGFFSDPTIYETNVPRRTQEGELGSDDSPRDYRRSDDEIKEEIHRLLTWRKQEAAADIQVDVQDGIVALTGSVTNQDEKLIAGKMIENVFGVMDVKNNLEIDRQ